MQPQKVYRTSRITVFIWLLSGLLALSACSGGVGTTAPTNVAKAAPDKQVFTFPEIGVSDIATFDPGLSTDLPSITAINMVYTGLVQLDNSLNVRGQLASSWTSSPSGLTWTFHLKPNLKFSDGTPLTSTDVAYSLDRALQPATASATAPIYLSLIKDSEKLVSGKIRTLIGDSVLIPDPNTIVIIANKKASYFLDALTYSCSYVVEKKLIDKYGKDFTDHLTEGGGDGPFKVQEYIHSKQIVFVPNPNYYGDKPALQKVIFPFYKDTNTAYQAYQVGQVDFARVPSPEIAKARPKPDYHIVPQLWIRYYAMNYLAKPFDSINMRKAFALAINKTELAHAIWKDRYLPTNHIIPKGMPGYNANLNGPDGTTGTQGNIKQAQQFFQQGLKDEGVTSAAQLTPIKLTYPAGSADTDNEVAAMVQMWQNVLGVSVKADAVDFNKVVDEMIATANNPNGLQFWGIAWIADYPDPQDWTTLQFDLGVPNNSTNYGQNNSADAAQQQAIQKQLRVADINPDSNARLQAYQNAEQQLVDDVAWIPVNQVQNAYVVKTYVQGLTINPENVIPPDEWAQIYVAVH